MKFILLISLLLGSSLTFANCSEVKRRLEAAKMFETRLQPVGYDTGSYYFSKFAKKNGQWILETSKFSDFRESTKEDINLGSLTCNFKTDYSDVKMTFFLPTKEGNCKRFLYEVDGRHKHDENFIKNGLCASAANSFNPVIYVGTLMYFLPVDR